MLYLLLQLLTTAIIEVCHPIKPSKKNTGDVSCTEYDKVNKQSAVAVIIMLAEHWNFACCKAPFTVETYFKVYFKIYAN